MDATTTPPATQLRKPARTATLFLAAALALTALAQDTIYIPPPITINCTAEKQWTTYVGGVGSDQVLSIATDAFGHVYVAGRTTDNLLLANDTTGQSGATYQEAFGGGEYDAFLAKYAPNGPMLWATYFGGEGDDEAVEVVVTGMDGVYIVGNTNSTTGIASDTLSLQPDAGGGSDMFIARFNEFGELLGATYFGGDDDEYATGAALDHAGRLLVCGHVNGPGGLAGDVAPVSPYAEGEDGILLLYAATDELLAGTFVGGEGDDRLVKMAQGDSTGMVLVGNTDSSTGIASPDALTPDLQGGTDGFIMKLDTNLVLLHGTYFGGTGDDVIHGLARSDSGWALCGGTTSDTLYLTPEAYQPGSYGNGEAFIAMLDADMQLKWSTFFGGMEEDVATAVFFDALDNLYVGGITGSPVGIATATDAGSSLSGPSDAFLLRFDSASADLTWSRYVGAMGQDEAHAMAVKGYTSVFLGGRTNSLEDLTFRAHQMDYGGGAWDGVVQRMDQKISTPAIGICTGTGGGGGGYTGVTDPLNEANVCLGDSITFIIYGGALGYLAEWLWYADLCGNPQHYLTYGDTITLAPTQSFTLYVRAENAEMVTTCVELPIHVILPPEEVIISVADTVCPGMPIAVAGTGADEFIWRVVGMDTVVTGDTTFIPAPMEPGAHTVIGTGINGGVCSIAAQELVQVLPPPSPVWELTDVSCHGAADGMISLDSLTMDGQPSSELGIEWEIAGLNGPVLTGLDTGLYVVTVTGLDGCIHIDSLLITQPVPLVGSINTMPSQCGDPLGIAEVVTESEAPGLLFDWGQGPDTLQYTSGLLPGSHTVVATESSGCMLSMAYVVAGHLMPEPVIAGPDSVCALSPVVLHATGADQFTWEVDGLVFAGDTISFMAPPQEGELVIVLTAVNGDSCSVGISHAIHIHPPLLLSWDIQGPSCANGSDGSISLDADDEGGLTITWTTPGFEGPVLVDLSPGEYVATTTDVHGCSRTDILQVTAPPPLIDSVSVTNTFCDKEVGAAVVHTGNTSAGLAFDWGGGPTAGTGTTGLAAGAYTVVATNDAGCMAAMDFLVEAMGLISVSIGADTLLAPDGQTVLHAIAVPADSAEAFHWAPETGLTDPSSPTTACTVDDTTVYVVKVTSLAGCTAVDTVVVIPFFQPPSMPCGEVFVPDLFSPNGDGLNDDLCVLGGCFGRMALHVYNRWGELVFATTDTEACWDGRFRGARAPEGTYLFTLTGERSNGELVDRTGTITLRR
ncbi:MAG TPA: gliding motility-associated C-terminal domain-containing protein [Flavobacteriales bacterium]|nr:gliding motility-associated C-terminal domain-containing protein [Flavobacteriales bacterium]